MDRFLGENKRINKYPIKCWADYAVPVVLTALFVVASVFVLPKPFYTNDQVLMRDLVSGVYTGKPDAHTVYIMYPLAWVFTVLYRITAKIAWYDWFMYLTFPVSLYIILRKVTSSIKNSFFKVCIPVALSFVYFSIYSLWIVQNEYTIDAGIWAMVGILLMFPTKILGNVENKSFDYVYGKKELIALVLSFSFCFLLRRNVFFEACPIIILIVLYLRLTKKYNRGLLVALFVLVGFNTVFYSIDRLAYSKNEWKQYESYNAARTQVFDYTWVPDYDTNTGLYEQYGIQKEEFDALTYGLGIVDDFDADTLMALSEANKVERPSLWQHKKEIIINSLDELKKAAKQPVGLVIVSLFIASIVSVFLSQEKRRWSGLLFNVLLVAYGLLFVFYFVFIGRFPERVSIGLYSMILAALLGFLLTSEKNPEMDSSVSCSNFVIWGFVIAGLLIPCAFKVTNTIDECHSIAEEMQIHIDEIAGIEEYCRNHDENVYYINAPFAYYQGDTMISNSFVSAPNFVTTVFWTLKSPSFEKRLERLGLNSLRDGLEKPDGKVFFVAGENDDITWFANLCDLYDDGVINESAGLDLKDSFMVGSRMIYVWGIVCNRSCSWKTC